MSSRTQHFIFTTGLVFMTSFFFNCSHMQNVKNPFESEIKPPVHTKIPHAMTLHGDTRTDDYFWMKKRDSEEVLKALDLENKYYEDSTKAHESQREKLFQEMKGRVKEDDSSVPYLDDGYWYYTRFELGQDYPIYSRKKSVLTAPEEILLNVNTIAVGKKFTEVSDVDISMDNKIMAYAVDHVGRRFYDILFVDLKSGQKLDFEIKNTSGSFVWTANSQYLFYTQQNAETLRSEKVFRYDLKSKKSELIFHEKDELFNVGLSKSKTKNFIFLYSGSFDSTEAQYIKANEPLSKFVTFLPREKKHEYEIEHVGDGFLILSNWNAENFRLMKAGYKSKDKSDWTEIIPHRQDTYLSSFQAFKSHVVLAERNNGLTQIRVAKPDAKGQIDLNATKLVRFPDPTYVVSMGTTPEYESQTFRYNYQSMVRPSTIYDFSFATGDSEIKKTQVVPTYSSELYQSERIWAPAQDGTLIPVSIVYKKSLFKKDGTNPLFTYGYGSYGYSKDAAFRASVVTLLDRGFVYAILHVRGGSEMGRQWYEKGRMMNKKNTFSDFVSATEYLLQQKYGDPARVFGGGGSAGGLLMGAIMNLRPDLYKGLILDVPFVDVLTTMLDPDIPLTAPEYEQWGNPNEKAAYDYIKTYSPYDQLKPAKYPYTFVFTGYHDSQVQYWEPMKFVAKVRDLSTSGRPILFRVDMNSGHGGASGRFQALKDLSHEFSFVLQLSGITD